MNIDECYSLHSIDDKSELYGVVRAVCSIRDGVQLVSFTVMFE